MSDNPFLDTRTDANPFLVTKPETTGKEIERTKAGKPRKERPNGKGFYSSDPKERMAQMQEDGIVGPQFGKLGGGRKRQHRSAAVAVAEMAAEQADAVRKVFLDGIDDSQPIGVRLQAAKELLKVESDQLDREAREAAQEFERMNKDQLVGSIKEMLGAIAGAGRIASEVRQLEEEAGIVDADVVEED